MLTTTHPERPADDKEAREAAVRADLNAEAEQVMHNSTPTPTQAEMDAIRNGKPMAVKSPENPQMSPLHEQRARMAEAGGEQPLYRTRQMNANRNPPGVEPAHTDEREHAPAAPTDGASHEEREAAAAAVRDEADRQHAARVDTVLAPAKKP